MLSKILFKAWKTIMMTKFMSLLLVLLSLSLNAVAAFPNQFCVFNYDGQRTFYAPFKDNLKRLANAEDIILTFFDAKKDHDLQAYQIDQHLMNCDGAIVITSSKQVSNVIIDRAKSQKIPIVFFNRKPPIDFYDKYEHAYFVGSSPVQTGVCLGQLVKDYIERFPSTDKNNNESIEMIALGGDKAHMLNNERNQAFIDYMLKNEFNLNPISGNFDDFDKKKAYQDVKNQIAKYGINNIEIIVADNDEMALGAVEALQEIGYNKKGNHQDKIIPVFGINGIQKAQAAVDQGAMAGTLSSDFPALSRACIEILKNRFDEDVYWADKFNFPIKDHIALVPTISFSKFADKTDKTALYD